jgi:hypothetical protein
MDPNSSGRSGVGSLILNLLTIVVVLATLSAGGILGAVFINPSLIDTINPYLPIKFVPPPTLMPTLGYPTITNTPEIYLPSTWTPTPTNTSTPTSTATATPAPSQTPLPATETPAQSPTPGGMPFDTQPGNPLAMQNPVNDLACQYMGIGGQVFTLDGQPALNLDVHVSGTLGGLLIDLHGITGSRGTESLGPGAYLIDLSDHPIASQGTLTVQLMDTSGVPLSDKISLNTTDSCDRNFILFNFRQIR